MIPPLVVDLGLDLGTTVTKLTALAEDGTKPSTSPSPPCGTSSATAAPSATRAASSLPSRSSSRGSPRSAVATAGAARDPLHRLHLDGRGRRPRLRRRPDALAGHRVVRPARSRAGHGRGPPELAHEFPARTGLPVTHVASLFKIAWLRDQGLSLPACSGSLPEFVIDRLGRRPSPSCP